MTSKQTSQFTIPLPLDLMQKLRLVSVSTSRSMAEIARSAICRELTGMGGDMGGVDWVGFTAKYISRWRGKTFADVLAGMNVTDIASHSVIAGVRPNTLANQADAYVYLMKLARVVEDCGKH